MTRIVARTRPPKSTGRKILNVLGIAAVIISAAVVGACVTLALTTANADNWGQWARDFAKSPGPAAFVALIAAVIAYYGISKQVTVARDTLSHHRGSAQEQSWWEVFQWATGRAVPAGKDDVRLPDSVTVDTLQRLADEATTDVQSTACKGMIEFLSARVDEEKRLSTTGLDEEVAAPPSATVSALARYVKATEGTAASSPMAEALVYENAVLEAVRSVGGADVKLLRGPRDHGADAEVRINGKRVFLLIKWGGDANRMQSAFAKTVSALRHTASDQRYLIITPFLLEMKPEDLQPIRAIPVRWRDAGDQKDLENALRILSTL